MIPTRNAALHGAVTDFTKQGAASHRFQLDDLVLATVEWVLEAAPAEISDLDEASRHNASTPNRRGDLRTGWLLAGPVHGSTS